MKTQYYTAASLDGFIATSDDSLDWLFALGTPEETSYPEFIKEVGAIAMGSAAGGKNVWLVGSSFAELHYAVSRGDRGA